MMLVRFPGCPVTLSLPFILYSLEGSHYVQPTLKRVRSYAPLHNLVLFCMKSLSLYLHLLTYPIIHLNQYGLRYLLNMAIYYLFFVVQMFSDLPINSSFSLFLCPYKMLQNALLHFLL